MTEGKNQDVINFLGNLYLRDIRENIRSWLRRYKRAIVGIYYGDILQYRQLSAKARVFDSMEKDSFVYVFYKDEDFNDQWDDFIDYLKEWLNTYWQKEAQA